jgi:hypothetical protein
MRETYIPLFNESPTNIIFFPLKLSNITVALNEGSEQESGRHLHD